jgi:hypothetical protein
MVDELKRRVDCLRRWIFLADDVVDVGGGGRGRQTGADGAPMVAVGAFGSGEDDAVVWW